MPRRESAAAAAAPGLGRRGALPGLLPGRWLQSLADGDRVRLALAAAAAAALCGLGLTETASRFAAVVAGVTACGVLLQEGHRGGGAAAPPPPQRRGPRAQQQQQQQQQQPPLPAAAAKSEGAMKQDSKAPVAAPRFTGDGFLEQVEEFLLQIAPKAESFAVAEEVAERARAAVREVFPEMDVVGIVSGDHLHRTAFGVAVPELDIVATASPASMLQHLQGRLSRSGLSVARHDVRKLQKSALRVCTDQLVSFAGFKFRRSAFRGTEPKVTLLAPAPSFPSSPPPAGGGRATAIDFSVNNLTPIYQATLFEECRQIAPEASQLVLLVRRWAKDRGICYAAQGHLPPYAWSLLAVYFLQVGFADRRPILPPLQGFKGSTGLSVRHGKLPEKARAGCASSSRASSSPQGSDIKLGIRVGELFKAFVRFYALEMDWCKEAASVRVGERAAPNVHLKLHIVVHEDGSSEVGPSIEDPFEPARNLGTSVTSAGIGRLREEFTRAHALLSREADLPELLELWSPPDPAPEQGSGSAEESGSAGAGGGAGGAPRPAAAPGAWPCAAQ